MASTFRPRSLIATSLTVALLASGAAGPAAAHAVQTPAVVSASSSAPWSPGEEQYGVGVDRGVPITMDDGVVLDANVYYPTEPSSGERAEGPFPVVFTLTPYGRNTGDSDELVRKVGMGRDEYLVKRGYIHLVVDARGTGTSQGTWSFAQPREIQDGLAVVDWAAELPQSNGSVGMMGASYGAINQLLIAGRIGPDSPLKAIVPIVPSADFYGDIHQGGVQNPLVMTAYVASNTVQTVGSAIRSTLSEDPGVEDIADLLSLLVSHTSATNVLPVGDSILGGPNAYRSEFWQDRSSESLLPEIVENDIPVMVIGGYRDAFHRSAPQIYAGLQNASAGRPWTAAMNPGQKISPKFQLIQGPWYHQTVDGVASQAHLDINAVALRWFDEWLKGDDTGVTDTKKPFRSFDITAQTWSQIGAFPFASATPTKFYLAGANALSTTVPAPGTDSIAWSDIPLCTPSISQFVLIGEDVRGLANAGLPQPACNLDDRPTQIAPLATTYTTTPFSTPRVIAGPISAHIVARVSSLDSEWVVRVEDVAPDGTSVPLTRGTLLGSLRALDESRTWRQADGTVIRPFHPLTAASAQMALPGTVQTYEVEVITTHATIAAGHRLRVTVSSNDSPAAIPTITQRLLLAGGVYTIERGGLAPSYVQIPLAQPSGLEACTDELACPAD